MLNNPAGMLYHSMDRRIKKDAETEKPKSVIRGLLAKSEDKMPTKDNDIGQPLDRVATYMTNIRSKRSVEE
tara:strand:+ start:506 stop:718 length:213 start_codon:yes stop_codon:yes gene_type:complete